MLAAYYSKGCKYEKLFAEFKISRNEFFKKHLNKYNVLLLDIQWMYGNALEEMKRDPSIKIVSYIQEQVIGELSKEYSECVKDTDVSLPDIARCCDVFYIGGTKVGALFGEAVVFTKKNMPKYFMTMVKQQGGLLAKGWLLGLQFDTLFTDNLYGRISKHAIDMAELLKKEFQKKGYEFFIESPTNQQFIIMENEAMERLKSKVAFGFWEKYDENRTVVRFATSWATKKEDVEALCGMI